MRGLLHLHEQKENHNRCQLLSEPAPQGLGLVRSTYRRLNRYFQGFRANLFVSSSFFFSPPCTRENSEPGYISGIDSGGNIATSLPIGRHSETNVCGHFGVMWYFVRRTPRSTFLRWSTCFVVPLRSFFLRLLLGPLPATKCLVSVTKPRVWVGHSCLEVPQMCKLSGHFRSSLALPESSEGARF